MVQGAYDFCYNLLLGNNEEALKSARLINDSKLWHNFAIMCVKSERMDLAMYCLSMTENAPSLQALRKFEGEANDVQAAMTAIHLGCVDYAEKILIAASKFRPLIEVYIVWWLKLH